MILALIVSTMIVVALVVFATQYYVYRKSHPKQDTVRAREGVAAGTHEAPITS